MAPVEQKALEKKRRRRHRLIAAALGAILAIVCRTLPPEYQAPCETVIKLCIGGL